jgi:indole-3-glycerol phosphate synthase
MPNPLETILAAKREHIARRRRERSESDLLSDVSRLPPPRPFIAQLQHRAQRKQPALIAEIKKASPSRGVIRPDFEPAALAVAYASAGAACLSVLTDEPFFQGRDSYLTMVRHAVTLPVLRKDFMLEPYQIVESRAIGADCVLLILAALSDAQAQELAHAAFALGMDVLLEVHDADELSRALLITGEKHRKIIGVNNRNLKTLEVDLATTETLAPLLPPDTLAVCESGIAEHEDILRMQASGVHCFLVGESLMRQPDVDYAVQKLLGVRH